MKKQITILIFTLVILISASAFITKSSNGSVPGYTGSPGEITCTGNGACHGGGSSASTGITITATPSFSLSQYMPDSTYLVSVKVGATGFSHFGFGCEILDSANGDAGVMVSAGSGVKFLFAGNGRKNALHTAPRLGTNSTTFTFHWVAPSLGTVNFYVCGNAVNLNGTTTGDLPIPGTMILTAAPAPVDTTTTHDSTDTGIHEITPSAISQISVYPNPASDFGNATYFLKTSKTVVIELVDIKGARIKELLNEKQSPGYHSQILNLQNVTPGIYFIKTMVDNQKAAQKLISVQ